MARLQRRIFQSGKISGRRILQRPGVAGQIRADVCVVQFDAVEFFVPRFGIHHAVHVIGSRGFFCNAGLPGNLKAPINRADRLAGQITRRDHNGVLAGSDLLRRVRNHGRRKLSLVRDIAAIQHNFNGSRINTGFCQKRSGDDGIIRRHRAKRLRTQN
ncbi:MAG: hypothetical protein ALAOOOJD_03891 [bacterium]|nr:hypothetical protein [bacterium]